MPFPGSQAEFTSLEGMGLAVAVLLIALLVPMLPASGRGLLKQPALFLVLHLAFLGLASQLGRGTSAQRFADFASVALLLASMGRSLVILVVGVVAGRRLARPVPRIVEDIGQGIVYLAALLFALRSTGVEPGSILTTSAILTAAIALSLQETLGNMVAGLAIHAERPFDVGDCSQLLLRIRRFFGLWPLDRTGGV